MCLRLLVTSARTYVLLILLAKWLMLTRGAYACAYRLCLELFCNDCSGALFVLFVMDFGRFSVRRIWDIISGSFFYDIASLHTTQRVYECSEMMK